MKRLITVLLALCCFMAPLTASLAQQSPSIDAYEYFADSKLDLEPYRGKAIVINFFTKWCPYCIQELPDFKKAFESFNSDELQFILVHPWDGETDKQSAEVVEEHGLQEMTVFEDEDMSVTRLVNPPGYPHSLFIDKDGNVLGYVSGALEYEDLVTILAEMGLSPVDSAE